MIPNPRVVSRELMTRDEFKPATILNLLAARLDPVHGPRLVRAQTIHHRRVRGADGGRRPVGRAVHQGTEVSPRAGAGRVDAAARLCEPEQPLVGFVAGVWIRSRHGREAPHPDERQAPDRAHRPAAGGPRDRRALQRLHRQLVDRPGDAPHAVHAGAQLHLRSARASPAALERRADLSEGQADQLGADGQDPHRRVDAGDRAAPADQAGDERQLVGSGRRGPPGRPRLPQRQGAARRHRRILRRSPYGAVLADRGVRLRLPDASADA